MLCLVHQTNYLLDQQLRQLERAFLEQGGFTERLYNARQRAGGWDGTNRTNRTDMPAPKKGVTAPKPPPTDS